MAETASRPHSGSKSVRIYALSCLAATFRTHHVLIMSFASPSFHSARQIEGRPMLAVYQYVRRKYNPLGGQGSWTTDEDDALYQYVIHANIYLPRIMSECATNMPFLVCARAYLEFGAKWELISGRVGRSGSDCRDRYRNHVAHKEKKVSGASYGLPLPLHLMRQFTPASFYFYR